MLPVVRGFKQGFELKHRVKGQSFRRLLFAKQIEYLSSVHVGWAEAKRSEMDAILNEPPFDDDAKN